jgi:hypothetical protein
LTIHHSILLYSTLHPAYPCAFKEEKMELLMTSV